MFKVSHICVLVILFFFILSVDASLRQTIFSEAPKVNFFSKVELEQKREFMEIMGYIQSEIELRRGDSSVDLVTLFHHRIRLFFPGCELYKYVVRIVEPVTQDNEPKINVKTGLLPVDIEICSSPVSDIMVYESGITVLVKTGVPKAESTAWLVKMDNQMPSNLSPSSSGLVKIYHN